MNEYESRKDVIVERIRHLERENMPYCFSVLAIYDDGRLEFEYAIHYTGVDPFKTAVQQAKDSGASKIEVSIFKTKTGKGEPSVFMLICEGEKTNKTTPPQDDIRTMITQTLGKLEQEQASNSNQLGEIQKLTLGTIKQGYVDQIKEIQHNMDLKELRDEITKKQQEIDELDDDYKELEKINEELTQKVLKSKRVDDLTTTVMAAAEAAIRMKPGLIKTLEPWGLSGIAQALVADQPELNHTAPPNAGVSSMNIDEGSIPQLEKIIRYFQNLSTDDKLLFYELVVAMEAGTTVGLPQLHQTMIKT